MLTGPSRLARDQRKFGHGWCKWALGAAAGMATGMATDRIDNDGIPSTVKVLPEWQHLQVGDTVPI
jgi:hypothetical protein